MRNIDRVLSGTVSVLAGTTHILRIFRHSWIFEFHVKWCGLSSVFVANIFLKGNQKMCDCVPHLYLCERFDWLNPKINENIWKYFVSFIKFDFNFSQIRVKNLWDGSGFQ